VLIGYAGCAVAETLGLKAAGLCLCLEDAAYNMATSHEVFQGPFAVNLQSDDRPIPAHLRPDSPSRNDAMVMFAGLAMTFASLALLVRRFVANSPAAFGTQERRDHRAKILTVGLGVMLATGVATTCAGIVVSRRARAELRATMRVSKILTAAFPVTDPGQVYDPRGLAHVAGAEFIASGVNSSDPNALALGREGKFFLWGFSGSPSEMTPSGRAVFLNVLC
jgi:hypothetical protein